MKEELRKKYLDIRNNISNRQDKDNIIYNKIINNMKVKNADTILIYVSTKSEVNTINLIKYFLRDKKVAVPKIIDVEMIFYYINSLNDLELGYFNILEPITNKEVTDFSKSISITPGICFSVDGYRIGYGKGFYDRFYMKNDVYKIGLCYQECLVNDFEHDSFDINVDEVISN